MSKKFALGNNNQATTLCRHISDTPKGRYFECLNGGWFGHLRDGTVHIEGTTISLPGEIVWEGISRFSNYNDALDAIDDELSSKQAV